MRFWVQSLGCKVNRVEADAATAALSAAGGVPDAASPEVVLVNTCTVTGEAEAKARKAVRQALSRHPQAAVVVTGCAAALNPGEFASLSDRVRVVAKDRVVEACREAVGKACAEGEEPAAPRVGEAFPTRVGIKVQDGCDNACTYCIVHVARGPARSRPLADCVAEARALAQAGVREAVLTGINVGTYASEGADLAALVAAMREAAPGMRLRLSSIEPADVSPRLIDAVAEADGWVCRHFHIPVQSGSTRVLREMARPYSAEGFAALVEQVRGRIPSISLSTDVICGFPGETDDDFQATLDLVRACRFSKVHAFRYSRREGTPAAARADQVPPQVIEARAKRLAAVAAKVRAQEAARRVGTSELVLVEASGRGRSESYFPVRTRPSQKRGELLRCTLASCDEDGTFTI